MSYNISGNKITMTRGDTAIFEVFIDYVQTGEAYKPKDGDVLQFSLKKYLSDKKELFIKDISIDTLLLRIESEDTANLAFGRYYYDIRLIRHDNITDTIIADILELTK